MEERPGERAIAKRFPPDSDIEMQTVKTDGKDISTPPSSHADEAKEQYETTSSPVDSDIENHADGGAIRQTTSNGSQLPMSKARTIGLVITLTGAAFLNTLSVQAAVIVLPTIGRDLNIPAARQQWIVSAYSLAFGCFLLLWGRLADVYGKRLIFISGSAWVCVVTLICPFIPSEIGFDVFRGLQGLGAAANVPTAIGILGVTFPPGKAKNLAFVTYSAGAPMGSTLGNILGGVVAEYANWSWIFWILAMIAFVVTVAGYFVIPLPVIRPSQAEVKNNVDWVGGMIITIALFALMFALTEGNVVGWGKPYIGVIIAVSIVLVVVFVIWQLYLEKRTMRRPLLKVTIFKNFRVSAACITMATFFSTFNNFLIFATYYFQDYHGLDAIETTVRFLPTGVVGGKIEHSTHRITRMIKLTRGSNHHLRHLANPCPNQGQLHLDVRHFVLHHRRHPLRHPNLAEHHILGLRLPSNVSLRLRSRYSLSVAHPFHCASTATRGPSDRRRHH